MREKRYTDHGRNKMISERINDVKKNIEEALEKSGRAPGSVKLIAVSKMKPSDMVKEAYDCGCISFGENYVQELVQKYEELPSDIQWHMIGHLQRNKVKYIVGKVTLIHSVDSLRLAQEINDRSAKEGLITDILAEVNVAGEDNKYGFAPEETESFAREVSSLSNIRLKGLMTSAPIVTDPEENRRFFKILRELSVDIDQKNIDNVELKELSMGMTGDYKVAIEEGATMVRVGTAIFGARDYGGIS